MLSSQLSFQQTDGQTDGQTPVKQYAPDLSMWEHKFFLKNSSCPYSASSPHTPGPCLLTDQNFANTLTHYQTTNFRPFQIERVCRRQFQI